MFQPSDSAMVSSVGPCSCMKVQVTSRHFRGRIDYLLGTRDRQLSLNVIVNGGSVRLGKSALDREHWTGKPRSGRGGTTRWDRQANPTTEYVPGDLACFRVVVREGDTHTLERQSITELWCRWRAIEDRHCSGNRGQGNRGQAPFGTPLRRESAAGAFFTRWDNATKRWDNEVGHNEVGQASQDHDWCEGSQVSKLSIFSRSAEP